MAVGYLMLAIPSPTPVADKTLFLVITCAALFVIAFGNGLFKGNLQALVGQMYDNPQYSSMRDSGFSLFYMFINVTGGCPHSATIMMPTCLPFATDIWQER